MSLTALGIALTVFACRDVTTPHDGSALASRDRLNLSGPVVVSPRNMHGWAFSDDQQDRVCTDLAVCLLVQGPGSPLAGTGSAELATPLSTDGKALVLQDYKGTRFDAITDLRYSTYRQSADAGNSLAIALQFNVDYDLTDRAIGYQGRMVFEPSQGIGGNVPQNTWQTWDAKAGKWWGTKASVPVNGALTTNSCVQATPCTWAQLLATFPNIGVHASCGAVLLKAGPNWAGFRGNADQLTIGVGGTSTTFDFELTSPGAVTLVPPDSMPLALFDSLGTVTGPPLSGGPFRKDIISVEFELDTPLAARQAAIDSIGGVAVGGRRYPEIADGAYYVRIQGGTTEALLSAVQTLNRQPQVAVATWWELTPTSDQSGRPLGNPNVLTGPDKVPALPPDSLPIELRTLSDTVSGGTEHPGPVLRDIIVVLFRPGTAQAERQAAIDSVHGVVVGGRRDSDGDGVYLVRVPTDGTIDTLSRITKRLNALRQVLVAMPDEVWVNSPTYLRPNDGPGRQDNDWRLDSSTASADVAAR